MLKRKPRTCFFMSNVCNSNNLPCWMIYLLLWCYWLVSLFWLYCKQHFNITLYVLSLLQNSKWRQKKSCSSIFALVLKKGQRLCIYSWYTNYTQRYVWFCLLSTMYLTQTWFYRILHMHWNVAVSLKGVIIVNEILIRDRHL